MDATSPATIKETCDVCVGIYHQCLKAAIARPSYNSLRREYDRLKIWAGIIGVYARPPGSADDRLPDESELRILTTVLLQSLTDALNNCLMAIADAQSLHDIDPLDSSNESSLSSASDGWENISQPVEATWTRRIRRVIGRLFSLLLLVRKPTKLSANEKVMNHDFQCEDQYQELIADFRSFIAFRLKHVFQDALSDDLRHRLVSAAVFRRKALILKSRHRRKLRGTIDASFPPVEDGIGGHLSSGLPGAMPGTRPADIGTLRSHAPSNLLSSTNPSNVAPSTITASAVGKLVSPGEQQLEFSGYKPQPKARSTKSVIMQRRTLDIPAPPKMIEGTSEVECYICGLSLDRTMTAPDQWKGHVLHDIDPFVCLFENCNKSDLLFKTSSQWYRHLQQHRMAWTCIIAAHRHMTFDSQEDLHAHIIAEHSSSLSSSQINLLIERGLEPMRDIFENCPMCGNTASDLRAVKSAAVSVPGIDDRKLLHRHIESHLYELALLSLLPTADMGINSDRTDVDDRPKMDSTTSSQMDLNAGDLYLAGDDVPRNAEVLLEDLEDADSAGQVPPDFFDNDVADKASRWRDYVLAQRPPPDELEDTATGEVFLTPNVADKAHGKEVISNSVMMSIMMDLDEKAAEEVAGGPGTERAETMRLSATLTATDDITAYDERFEHIEMLGTGAYGTVDRVREISTSSIYARKTFRPIPHLDLVQFEERIKNECEIMTKLRHNHIASVNMLFKVGEIWSIIMLPAAECDLRYFLEQCIDKEYPRQHLRLLDTWFGCLISALAYAHGEMIKHEDIKPSNILIKDERVYLTDFGCAKDFSELEASTVADALEQGTPTYWAPEPRPWGRSADVFALGCVFSEMITVRQKRSLKDYRTYRLNPVAENRYAYKANLEKVRLWLTTELRDIDSKHPVAQLICELTLNMLVEDSTDRPAANRIRLFLRAEECLFCRTCY